MQIYLSGSYNVIVIPFFLFIFVVNYDAHYAVLTGSPSPVWINGKGYFVDKNSH